MAAGRSAEEHPTSIERINKAPAAFVIQRSLPDSEKEMWERIGNQLLLPKSGSCRIR